MVLVGTAGPMSPNLAQNSTAVFVNGKFLLFDAGDYAQKRMEQFNLPVADLVVMDTMSYDLVEALENVYRKVGNDRLATIFYDIREYHPDVHDIAAFATEQRVARLALTHYAPSVQSRAQMRRVYIRPIKAGHDGELIAGGDGTTITIPLD